MSIKSIETTATFAWSPPSYKSPLLAVGTVAGAMDASFSTSTELELYDLDLSSSTKNMIKLGSTSSDARFHRLSWCPVSSKPMGLLAGGLENGHLNIWDPQKLTNDEGTSLIESFQNHQGGVRGLDFNPFQPNLLASGANDGEIFIWDLLNTKTPYTPGAKSQKLEDITCLKWNRQVQHILASSSINGYTVIWDLRNKREIMQLANPNGRRSITAISWNPDMPTQIVTASDDDAVPVIQFWDLKNAHAPEKTFTGHNKGILSLAWCPKDSQMLLSSGKDNRILCWNPSTSEIIGELPSSNNWTFEVQWCPRNPDLISASSFDGKVSVFSLSKESSHSPTVSKSNDPFSQAVPQQSVQLQQTPKWLCRPIGASFAFGGKIVSFLGKNVKIARAPTDISFDKDAQQLQKAFETNDFVQYCGSKIKKPVANIKEADQEVAVWSVMKIMFERDPRQRLLGLLGYDRDTLVDVVSKKIDSLGLSRPTENVKSSDEPKETDAEDTNQIFGEDTKDFPAQLPKLPKHESFKIFESDCSDIDRLITRSVIVGDFQSAVDLCLNENRMSEALVLAVCGGSDLLSRTQQVFFDRVSSPYLRLVSAIVKNDLLMLVEGCQLEEWVEILAVLCTFAKSSDFANLCTHLAERLEPKNSEAAVICYLISGNVEKVSQLWVKSFNKELRGLKKPQVEKPSLIQGRMEKIAIFRKAIEYVEDSDANTDEALFELYSEYAELLASQGYVEAAMTYLQWTKDFVKQANDLEHDKFAVLRDRLHLGNSPSFPFKKVDVDSVKVAAETHKEVNNGYAAQSNNYQGYPSSYNQSAYNSSAAYDYNSRGSSSYQSGYNASQAATVSNQNYGTAAPSPYAAPTTYSAAGSYAATNNYASSNYGATAPVTYGAPEQAGYGYGANYYNQPTPPRPSIPTPAPIQQTQFGQTTSPVSQTPPSALNRKVSTGYNDPPMKIVPSAAAASASSSRPNVISAPFPGSVSGSVPYSPQVQSAPPRPISTVSTPQAVRPAPPSGYTAPYVPPPQPGYQNPGAPKVNNYPPPAAYPPGAANQGPPNPSAAVQRAPQAAPAPEKKRYPPGDRSQISSSRMSIVKSLEALLGHCKQRVLPQQKRIVEDAEKRFSAFFDSINNGEVSEPTFAPLLELCKALDARDYVTASNIQVQIMGQHYAEAGAAMLAVKRLLDMAKTFQ